MNLFRSIALSLALLMGVAPAVAQWQTPNHSVPVGRGAGVTGFGNVAGANGQALFGVTGADPLFRAPSFTDLIGNIAISQMNGGANASAATYWRGDGTWSTPASFVADVATLKALDTTTVTNTYLTDANRAGNFKWTLGNYTAAIAADANNGVYVKANAITAATGAWVRQFDFTNFNSQWFGAPADYVTDSTAIINTMIATGNVQNSGAFKQTAVYINVQGGVMFASQNLSWLPAVNWVFVYVRYFANSDTTKGVSTGGGGTNEQHQISVNSGFPDNINGTLVGEWIDEAPNHPARGVNIKKNIDNSIGAHLGGTIIQPSDNASAKGTVAYVRDENLDRFRITYEHFAGITGLNGVLFYVNTRTTNLVCVGCNGATWGANIPAVGAVVRGITTLSRYQVTSLATPDILQTEWVSGEAVPGEFLMNERAMFAGSISGTTLTVATMFQGAGNIAVGQTVVGMYANNGVTATTTITGLGTGTGGVGTYSVNNSQSIASTQMTSGYVAANSINGGGVGNTDTLSVAAQLGFDGSFYTRNATFLNRSKVTLANSAAGATATLTNAPTAGNPTKWISIDDNGVTRRIPTW